MYKGSAWAVLLQNTLHHCNQLLSSILRMISCCHLAARYPSTLPWISVAYIESIAKTRIGYRYHIVINFLFLQALRRRINLITVFGFGLKNDAVPTPILAALAPSHSLLLFHILRVPVRYFCNLAHSNTSTSHQKQQSKSSPGFGSGAAPNATGKIYYTGSHSKNISKNKSSSLNVLINSGVVSGQ
jgi:hypothetical protein